MGIYVNRGNESFRRAVNSQIYVDKTGLLEYTNRVLDTEQGYLCVSRPRRFGKSIAAGMLTAYYSRGCDSQKLFENLSISRTREFKTHLNKYNVIHLDIAYLRSQLKNAMDTVVYLQKCVISELREMFPQTVDASETSLPFVLANINKVHGERFIIIIDEWDAIFREDRNDYAAQEAYIELLRELFKGEPAKSFLILAYITGILPVKKYNSESALNNFDEFTMVNPAWLAEYVGFTEPEVRQLCDKYSMDFSDAEQWYDGYAFRTMQHIYSPNSVVKAMFRGEYGNYWTSTVAYESLKSYISMNFEGLKDDVIRMLAGERSKVNIESFENDMTSFKRKDDVLTILVHLGYLSYDSMRREVYIPNQEVRSAFSDAVLDADWKPVADAIKASWDLLVATWNKDENAVAKGIDEIHMANTSILEYNDENALSCVITLAYYHAPV